jgi:DNA helicase-2/ATP-dependent DNA helicase PcrA
MKERLSEFPDIAERAYIGTLHSFCMEILASRGGPVGIAEQPHIFESFQDRTKVMAEAASTDPELSSLLAQCDSAKRQGQMLASWLQMVDAAKNRLQTAEMLNDEIERKIYESYDKQLRVSDAVDFNDLLLLTYRLFIERPKIADFFRRQYRFICIDEAQDLNHAQYELLKALCGDSHRNVMMVGDPKQAIYVFNGGNPKFMKLFEKEFSAKRYELNENFRSSKAVVDAASKLLPGYTIAGQLPIAGEIRLIEGNDAEEEARLVIEYLKGLLASGHDDVEDKLTLDSCALLARNRYVFQAVEKLLVQEKMPFYKKLSTQHESESYLIRDFENCLRVLANPKDQLHLGMLVARWNVSSGAKRQHNPRGGIETIEWLATSSADADAKACRGAIKAMDWNPNGFRFTKALDLLAAHAKGLASPEEHALIVEDINVWRRHWDVFLRTQQQGIQNLAVFLSSVAMGTTQQPRQEGLALLTVHSAKGLEFDVVVVMGMTEGTFPDYRAMRSAEGLEEEGRNAFVAITRSKRLLALSFPKKKMMPWGDEAAQKPSRYLEAIGLVNTSEEN